MLSAQHADALRIELASVEVPMLAAVGTIPGVAVLYAAGHNGPGQGRLKSHGETVGTLLYWRAPGSETYGPPHRIEANGQCVLEDGEDPSKYVRVQVWTDHLCPGACERSVNLRELFNNEIGQADTFHDDATEYAVSLTNDGIVILSQMRVWLDPTTSDLWIAYAPPTWVNPTTEETALLLPDLAPGQSHTLEIFRLFVDPLPDAEVLNLIHLSWHGL